MPDRIHKKKEQALATKQNILDAAEHIFFEKGAALTTLEQIAEKAGVTRGAIYGHFKNKNVLLEHMIDSAVLPVLDIFREALAEKSEASLEQLCKANVKVVLSIIRSPELTRRLSIAMLKCEYTEEFSYLIERSSHYREEIMELYMAYFSRIKERRVHLTNDPQLFAHALIFYVSGMLNEFFRHPHANDLEKNVKAYFDIFFSLNLKSPV